MFVVIFGNKYKKTMVGLGAAAMLLACVFLGAGCRNGEPGDVDSTETAVSVQTSSEQASTEQAVSENAGEAEPTPPSSGDDGSQSPEASSDVAESEGSDSDASGAKKVRIRDVVYVSGDVSRTMDIIYEKNGEVKPVLLLVHGGSYIKGDKADMLAYQNYYYKKYVTVSINYPLLPNATMVSQYRCVEQALAFLADHADELDADMQNVVVLGFSAGAQIAVRACEEIAIRASNGEELPYSVIGIIDDAGPTDQRILVQTTTSELLQVAIEYPEVIDGVKGSSLETELMKIDCSVNIVRGMPPVLIIHGKDDNMVDYEVSVAFYEALKEQDVDVTFKLFEGQVHGVDLTLSIPCINDFLDKVVGA